MGSGERTWPKADATFATMAAAASMNGSSPSFQGPVFNEAIA